MQAMVKILKRPVKTPARKVAQQIQIPIAKPPD